MSKKAINSREYEPDFKDLGALEPGACDLWKAYPKMLGTFVHLLRGTACMGHGKETGIRIPDFPDVEAWFEVPKSRAENRAEGLEERDPGSILYYFRRLVALRKEHPVISEGSVRFLKTGNEKVLAYERALGGQRLTVVCSFSAGEEEIVGIPLQGRVILCNYPTEEENGAADRDLKPFEAVAVLREVL